MSHSPLLVRQAVADDFAAMLAMKSDAEAIQWSGFASAPDNHRFREWFLSSLKDPKRLMFIGIVDSDLAGYAQFLRSSEAHVFEISYGIALAHRGRGLAAELLLASMEQVPTSDAIKPRFHAW